MAVLTSKRVKKVQADFSGGQNSGDEPSNIGENQAELIENTIITNKGKATQRKGIARVGDNPDTLISHWTFDNSDATDDKGSNDASAEIAITYVSGKFGKAASFNGASSYIKVDADSTIDATSMVTFRISAYVYIDSDGEGSVGRIFSKWGTNTGYRAFVSDEGSGTVLVTFDVGYPSGNARVKTSTTVPTGEWVALDFFHNADKSNDIYINGALASYGTDTSGTGTIGDDSAVNLFFGNASTEDNTFDGEIDDIRIYDGAFTVDDAEKKAILGMTRFWVGTTYDKLIRAKNTDIQELNTDFKTWDNITGLTGLTAGLTTNFVQANDRLFILNGTDNVYSINSSLTVTDEGNTNADPPLGTFGEWTANNRLFISGHQTQANRDLVWFSNSLDPQTFVRDTNYFSVAKGQGGKVTWLKMFKEFELIIYKENNIYVLNMDGATPLTDWSLKPLSIAVGCPAGRTVQDIGNDHIFLGNDGVRLLSRTAFDKLRVGVISEPIQDIIDDINQDAVNTAVGHFENGLYILGVPVGTSTYPNRFVIWDSIAAARNGNPSSGWTVIPEDTWNFSCMESYQFGDNLNTIVAGDARALTLCYKVLSGNTDNGETVTQTIIGKEQDYDEPFVKKIFDPSQFIAETGSDGNYSYYLDIDRTGFVQVDSTGTLSGGLTTPFTTPATTGGSDSSEKNVRTKFLGRGNTVRFKVVNTEYNKRPTFLEYSLFAKPYQGRI